MWNKYWRVDCTVAWQTGICKTLEVAIKKYEEFGQQIFSKKLSYFSRWDATYDHTVVEKLLKKAIRESPLNLHEDAVLKDASRPCRSFVITTKLDKHSSSPIIMRSYDLDEDRESSVKIWEAGRATSAAPTYFKPITINNDRYSDGGTIANNPSHHAIMEAAKIWKLDNIGCIVSLGTGPAGEHTLDNATEEILGSWGMTIARRLLTQSLYYRLQLAFYSLQVMTSTERTHLKTKEMVDVFRRMHIGGNEINIVASDDVYYRLNLTSKEAKVGLDAWKQMGLLQRLATEYMKTNIIAIETKMAIARVLAETAKKRLPPSWIAPEEPVRVLELYMVSCQHETHKRVPKLVRIDNTAENNFISDRFATELGLTRSDVVASEKTVFTSPSHKIIRPEFIVEINLSIGSDKNMHIESFFVIEDDFMPADILVGFDFTMKHKVLGREMTKSERVLLVQAAKSGKEAGKLPLKKVMLSGDSGYGEIVGSPAYKNIAEDIVFLDRPSARTLPADSECEAPSETSPANDAMDEKDSSDLPPPSQPEEDEREREALLEELLKHDELDIDGKDENGQTLLSQAAKDGDDDLVRMLLKTGKVDVNSEDYSGRTALAVAARNGHLAVVKLLLDTNSVDVASKDIYGETALSIAEMDGHDAIVELLKQPSGEKA
ncbi:hypothetical protein ACMFMF_011024 [Clarireedia jacksonii]